MYTYSNIISKLTSRRKNNAGTTSWGGRRSETASSVMLDRSWLCLATSFMRSCLPFISSSRHLCVISYHHREKKKCAQGFPKKTKNPVDFTTSQVAKTLHTQQSWWQKSTSNQARCNLSMIYGASFALASGLVLKTPKVVPVMLWDKHPRKGFQKKYLTEQVPVYKSPKGWKQNKLLWNQASHSSSTGTRRFYGTPETWLDPFVSVCGCVLVCKCECCHPMIL